MLHITFCIQFLNFIFPSSEITRISLKSQFFLFLRLNITDLCCIIFFRKKLYKFQYLNITDSKKKKKKKYVHFRG